MSQSIAIIGGGASGALVVLNILKQATKPISILWFDKHNVFCKGLAYSTSDENHLLNVRASNMSVFTDEPTHFVNWLVEQKLNYTKDSFVPRNIYGEYIKSTLDSLSRKNNLVNISLINAEVIDIVKDIEINLKTDTNIYKSQAVVLALGNFLPAHPRSIKNDFIASSNYFHNAFSKDVISNVRNKKNVAIIGSGLTMIDIVVSLYHQKYTGTIHVISPHGYIPQAHSKLPLSPISSYIYTSKTYTLIELTSIINLQIKKAKKENIHWHCVIDALRPHLQHLWQQLSTADKQQFFRHLRHKWGVARHRAPLESINVIQKLIEYGKLNLIKGRIHSILTTNNSFSILYKNNATEILTFNTEAIINCTGPESDFEKIDSPLVQQLLKNNFIEVDDIRYGIKANSKGKISNNLYTLGPPLKGLLWESTAIPEIRMQAFELTKQLI